MANPTLITPEYVFDYPTPANVCDYRSVVNAAGTAVLFERAPVASGKTTGPVTLYLVDLAASPLDPTPFFTGKSPPEISTRPDWCWSNGAVAFNYSGNVMVGVAPGSGVDPVPLGASTAGMNYPTWFPDGSTLAVENAASGASPSPNTTTINSKTGAVIASALEGSGVFGGMPSVNPANPNLIAFAGQPVGANGYNQNQNFIYVLDTWSGDPPTLLETGETTPPANALPQYQGRAPWWSPDGQWLVFESYRASPPTSSAPDGMFAIFLYRYGAGPAIQLTDPIYNCQHAKFYPTSSNGLILTPDCFVLTVAAFQTGENGPQWPFGLARLNLGSLQS